MASTAAAVCCHAWALPPPAPPACSCVALPSQPALSRASLTCHPVSAIQWPQIVVLLGVGINLVISTSALGEYGCSAAGADHCKLASKSAAIGPAVHAPAQMAEPRRPSRAAGLTRCLLPTRYCPQASKWRRPPRRQQQQQQPAALLCSYPREDKPSPFPSWRRHHAPPPCFPFQLSLSFLRAFSGGGLPVYPRPGGRGFGWAALPHICIISLTIWTVERGNGRAEPRGAMAAA